MSFTQDSNFQIFFFCNFFSKNVKKRKFKKHNRLASATRPTIQFKYKYNFDKGEWNQTNTNTILFKIKIGNNFTQIQLLNLTISNNFTNKFALRLKSEITI